MLSPAGPELKIGYPLSTFTSDMGAIDCRFPERRFPGESKLITLFHRQGRSSRLVSPVGLANLPWRSRPRNSAPDHGPADSSDANFRTLAVVIGDSTSPCSRRPSVQAVVLVNDVPKLRRTPTHSDVLIP